MLICNMHPTILHENSTLYSSDFPHYTRIFLQDYLGKTCTVVYFTGTAGNQSPRHVTKSNTFEEAERIGKIVADAVISQLEKSVHFSADVSIYLRHKFTDLPKRQFPSVEWAEYHRDSLKKHFDQLQNSSKDIRVIRTAEVNWFGSEELLFLSSLAQSNGLDRAYETILPAEIQIIKIGDRTFIAWPGEVFVEYGLEL